MLCNEKIRPGIFLSIEIKGEDEDGKYPMRNSCRMEL